MWIVSLTIFIVIVSIYFFIRKELAHFDNYPTGTALNEDSLKFNSEEWKKQREYYEEIRPYMLKDLMTNVLLVGMDSTAIKNLLGETWGPHDSRWWDYRLGVYREIEASYLVIEFDDKGKLKRADIVDR
jgi:hypothetical protein